MCLHMRLLKALKSRAHTLRIPDPLALEGLPLTYLSGSCVHCLSCSTFELSYTLLQGKAAFIPPTEERQPITMLRLLQHRVRCTFTEVCYTPIATHQCTHFEACASKRMQQGRLDTGCSFT